MAVGLRYVCGGCRKEIEAWSDGNPYFLEFGEKEYAYHPDHERLAKCIGNDDPHLCLACGAEFMVDSRAPTSACPKCEAEAIKPTFDLDGAKCPFCPQGHFSADPDYSPIS
jgi:DNA-directed RNA polymerase subunit RPC12/RpoP